MAKQLIELQAHNRFGWEQIREPLPKFLGFCPCGCHEAVTSDYAYAKRGEDEYFVDRSHFIDYVTKFEDYQEVG